MERRTSPTIPPAGWVRRIGLARGQTHALTLVESETTPSGVTLQIYRPAGRATFGAAGK